MAENQVSEDLHCIGCGAKIQSKDESKPGFVPPSALASVEDNLDKELYCKRCFRLRNYNEVPDVNLTSDEFLTMLNDISDKNALIVNVVDIFDFNGTVIPGINRFAGSNPVLLVGNKVDLLPKSLKLGKLRQWMVEQAQSYGIRPIDVSLISAFKTDHVRQLLDLIEKYRQGRDVYVVGTTNVGKSTIINQIIQEVTETKDLITTSYFPGTTLGRIEIPLEDGSALVDTPGIIHKGQISHYLNEKELKATTPRKEIKPKVYQLNEGQTLYLAGLARLDYVQGSGNQSFVAYVSNDLKIHRTKTEKADELFENNLGKLLTPPFDLEAKKDYQLTPHEFTTKEPSDIVFSGLGFIHIDQAKTKVKAYAPKNVDIFIRKGII